MERLSLWRIHSDWREQIKEVLNTYQVPIQFSEPNTGHSDSDDCGSIYSVAKVIAFGMTIRVQG